MSLPSPTSPEGLRRRGRLSADTSWPGEASTSKQPISPVSPVSSIHRRKSLSATSDGFGDFVTSNEDLQQENEMKARSGSTASIDDDWQDADLVQSFSPVAAKNDPVSFSGPSATLNAPDWDAWETPRGPTPQPIGISKGASSTLDDTFFDAFEKATISQQRIPSPPIIDLREMEKKLERTKAAQQGLQPSDLDFFESFEKKPAQVMMSSREKAEGNASLKGIQLESMKEAQTSPMNIITPNGRQRADADYFGSNQDLMMNSPEEDARPKNGKHSTSHSRSDSWSEAAGQWAGTFRKTLGTLRGQAAELAQHLPSSKDFIVPEGELEEESEEVERRAESSIPDQGVTRTPSRRIAKASDHSQSSPFGTSSGSGPAASPPVPFLGRNGSVRAPPISGAPGFNPNPVHNWNTGSWSLTSSEEMQRNKRPIPVELKGRRDETQDVMSKELAAHLTAHLPKRLQLGKSWKLLYSSDQHGISLGTLYAKVQSGLELGKGGQRGEATGLQDAEGWLRGASQATQEAVTGIRRFGGGLNMSEAGLVVAIRDSDDKIFGAYVNERLRAQSSYYGNGECFLWKAINQSEAKTFKWTGRNDYMVLTEAHYLSFGGGDGKYGLWLDGQLETGISAKCPAFDNDVLCTASKMEQEGHFECIVLEVWACGID